MNKKDWRDYTTYAFAGIILIYASWYLFGHPSEVSFATWAGIVGSITAVLRWLDISDDKRADQ